MPLKGARIVPKGDKPRYQDRDVWEKSSDIVTYNLYENEWDDLVSEGLTHIFNNDKDLFEKRKEVAKCKKEMTEEINEITETTEGVDETTLLDL
ncbi:hypothetical protein MHI02_05705 [Oceanobacillus sp. FSL K6-0118]|uniref:hypothetical protein n=1 Tax=Oceanobacillus sp. FSL K6-0118 TaxID=2921418 RepID=UPI0030F7F4CA